MILVSQLAQFKLVSENIDLCQLGKQSSQSSERLQAVMEEIDLVVIGAGEHRKHGMSDDKLKKGVFRMVRAGSSQSLP